MPWVGFVKPINNMKNQELLNAIATLTGVLDSLVRAEKKDAVTTVVETILKLVKKVE